MNKKLSLVALTAVAALALTGCTTTSKSGEVITLEQPYKITTSPQWSKSSVAVLQKDGWKVDDNQRIALEQDDFAIPGTFYASKGDCVIQYNVFFSALEAPGAGESYLTRDKAYLTPKSVSSKDMKESLVNINIQDSSDKLELLKLEYSYPNMVSSSSVPVGTDMSQYSESNPPPAPILTQEGTSYEALITRTIASEVPNPYAYLNPKMDPTNPPVGMAGLKGSPVLEFTYKCIGTPLDQSLLSKLIETATINQDPLPVTKK